MRVKLSGSSGAFVQGSFGSGIGRYIGGLVPDVAFRSDSSISPIRTWSWVGGVEQKVQRLTVAGYYSGVYVDNNFALDTDGSFIGYGFPGSSSLNNRVIQEGTVTATDKIFELEGRGSMQLSLHGVLAPEGALVAKRKTDRQGRSGLRANSLQPAVSRYEFIRDAKSPLDSTR